MKKSEYLTSAGVVQDIRISEKDGVLNIFLPRLMPRRKGRKNSEFLTDPLYFTLSQYADSHELPKFQHCVICFSHIYSKELPLSRVRDYDNLELKQLLDVIAAFVMEDDSGLLCDAYNTTELGEQDCTCIEWKNGCLYASQKNFLKGNVSARYLLIEGLVKDGAEVIGNIYESPELLEG